MSKKIFMLDVISPSRTLSVEVDENKTLKECLKIANEMGKNCRDGYIMKIGHYVSSGGGNELKVKEEE